MANPPLASAMERRRACVYWDIDCVAGSETGMVVSAAASAGDLAGGCEGSGALPTLCVDSMLGPTGGATGSAE